MPDLTAQSKINVPPMILDYRNIGTAAGTVTLANESAYIEGIQVTTRKAAGKFILYDSAGTSTSVIGTVTMGTNTADDPPYIPLGFRTNNGLTVANDADFGGIVKWGK